MPSIIERDFRCVLRIMEPAFAETQFDQSNADYMLELMSSTNPHIPVKRLHADARLPLYAHTGPFGDLAADLYSVHEATVEPHKTVLIATGLAMVFPAGFGALVEDRSGLAVKGLTTLAGVIDPGYRGEIKVVLINITDAPIMLAAGDRIAQLRIVQKIEASFEEVDDLDATHRGEGGFGSTGN